MTNSASTVLVVDDDPANLALMEDALGELYIVVTADSGARCLEYVEQNTPDLILLDVRMPGMGGYAVCEKIKDNDKTNDIPVIFLSAQITLEDKLKGYEAKGDDYITKPCDLEEVLVKVKFHIGNSQTIAQTRNLAMMAITNASELGLVNQFYEKSFACLTLEELALEVLKSCGLFGLECCVQIRTSRTTISVTSSGAACTPLENQIMDTAKNKGRILHFGNRALYNFDNITLVVKNMPREDEEKCGRLNDHIASLLGGADARTVNIDVEEQQRSSIMKNLGNAVNDINSAIQNIQRGIKEREHLQSQTISSLLDEMNLGFSTLALTEDQEEFFINLVNNHMDKIVAAYTNNKEVETYFSKLAQDLSKLLDSTKHQSS